MGHTVPDGTDTRNAAGCAGARQPGSTGIAVSPAKPGTSRQ